VVDVFISYSRRNLEFVHRLDAALTAQGKVRNCADPLASYGVPEALTIYSVLHDYYRAA
jgi:hypothetical protein